MVRTRPIGWGWIVAAVIVAFGVAVLAVTTQGACYDSVVPGGSSCTSGPILGWPGTILAIVGAVAFAVFAVTRAVRR